MKKVLFTLFGAGILILFILKVDLQKRVEGCAFCREEIIDRQFFYQKDGILGLVTHKPAALGHVLIIPERHVERFEDLTSSEVVCLAEAIKEIDKAVQKSFGNRDYLLLQKNGKEAGQSVPHLHFHYLPAVKYLPIRFFISPWLKPLEEEKLKSLKETLSESLEESLSTASNPL